LALFCVSAHVSWAPRIWPCPGPGPAGRVAGRGWKQFAVDFEKKGEEMNETFSFSSEGGDLGFALTNAPLQSVFDLTASL